MPGSLATVILIRTKQKRPFPETASLLSVLMGPSGSGKTTLLNILSGTDTEYIGNIEIAEADISKMSMNELALFRRRQMGFVLQDYNLLDSLLRPLLELDVAVVGSQGCYNSDHPVVFQDGHGR
ncbi:ABC transporter [Paenibacillus sophorae]|uniref:ABC transporter n=1 Tax=Paenibacillus sophorae TaxID=1333845 RepID=A0A1H8IWS8_9BACL|nr:ATP-binding cassette domain-containing protein [Paenibacillus sophorae]SEN72901.1 ABC transporter [Paenibacillus sophorae]